MGTEIFPQILFLIRIVVIAVCAIAALVVVLATIEWKIKYKNDKAKQEEMKELIMNGLIAITIVLIAYFVLVAIGPAFRLILT